jgi:microcystin-dependent protein
MANYEATRYDFDGANLTGIEGVNTGIIVPWSDSSIPSGFLECNGQAVSQSTYAALYAIIGTTYGDPGGGNFNVPDLQDNVVVGKSNTKALATTGGAENVTSTGNVGGSTANATLTVNQLASHNHQLYNPGPNPQGNVAVPSLQYNANPGSVLQPTNAGNDAGHSHNMSANFSGDATSVLQPYLTVIYIIKT